MKSHYSFRLGVLVLCSAALLNACSVLVGQVKPEDEKAPLAVTPKKELLPSAQWTALAIPSSTQSNEDVPDAAWQSNETGSVISVNSVCRQNFDEGGDLKRVTRMLTSQWDNLKIENERSLIVSGHEALETTALGHYLNRERRFQTVVVKSPTCVYDLVFLSPVQTFDQELSVFQKFRDNLNLK